ncbi:hypothetical protein MUS_2660 [Bacillus velezensis YAU B9601-Y2]|uniref:Uncharacterized protein n=1 Tax=Bacillus amyloliquefaciens (strain Y2) TaxID=1155777 RepID=I2C7E8_BACAY|nr:hypothetical protein MUS_2660 [Bacillus velezensis YAU B9601-Y2]
MTPPAIAVSLIPLRKLSAARWTAVKEEEHAVSTAILGPWKLNKNDTLFAIDQSLGTVG